MDDRRKKPADLEAPPPAARAFADILADFVDVLNSGG